MSVPEIYDPITELPPYSHPIFLGTGLPNTQMTVCQANSGNVLVQTTIDENGNWLSRSNQALPQGPYTITAFYDLAQGYAPALTFYVGTPPPQSASSITSDNTPILTSPTVVDSLRPTLKGTAAPNAIVVIDHAGGSPRYGTAHADSQGHWEHIPTTDLKIDANNWVDLAFMAIDAANTPLSPWAQVTLAVLIASGSGSLSPGPTLTSSTSVTALRPTLTGTARPGTYVNVAAPGFTSNYGAIQVPSSGIWTLTLNTDLVFDSNNQVALVLAEADFPGNIVSNQTAVTLTLSNTGTNPGTGPRPGPVITSSTTLNPASPTLSGTATPGATVTVYKAGSSVTHGSAVTGNNGVWTITLTGLVSGIHAVTLAETNAQGAALSNWTAATLSLNATGTSLRPGPVLTSATTVSSKRPTFTGTATPNSYVIVTQPNVPSTSAIPVSATGIWSWTPTSDFTADAFNQISIVISEIDLQGNLLSNTTNATLTLGTTGTNPGTGPRPGPVITSSTTLNPASPTLSGTATPGTTVTVYKPGGGVIYGSAITGNNGVWTITLSGLVSGNQSVDLAESDAQGAIVSGWTSATLNLAGGSTLPPGPILTSSTSVTALRPTLTGTARPGTYVNVAAPGFTSNYGAIQVPSSGIWTLTLNTDLVFDSNNQVALVLAEADFPGNIVSNQTAVTLTLSNTGTNPGTGPGTTPGSNPGTGPVITSSTIVNSKRPTLFGTATPGRYVMISEANNPANLTSQVSPGGIWSWTPPSDLVTDAYNLVNIQMVECDLNYTLLSPWTSVVLTVMP